MFKFCWGLKKQKLTSAKKNDRLKVLSHGLRAHGLCNIIGASLSEPLLDELAGAFLWYIYIYLYPWAVHLVPRGPPVNAQRANVRPAE